MCRRPSSRPHRASPAEPSRGRADTRGLLWRFVRSARADGLLAETCLLLRRATGWAPEQYSAWLRHTLGRVLEAPSR
ncbi:hypothetical protein [Actinomadura bangladeshensis]|uniref:Uncharacterized protein n=1 Tax=Actinomadura bangladeshensis TaxID=453573 RepID=A0A6L9QSI0_9ACTN|nr:hypothetical protein [Actinomadura bangladeshensis]NEA26924.1 hypothetical protein [Actinomadura bangladeshensis]